MRFFLPVVLCVFSTCAAPCVHAQSAAAQPLSLPAGTIATFYSQTRLNQGVRNALDDLPKGTVLKVRIAEAIDSNVDRDGLEFHGTLAASLGSQNGVTVHAGAAVRGLLVLLRNSKHPEGFRYELLITSITENDKSYELTASLHPSFLDTSGSRPENSVPSENEKDQSSKTSKVAGNKN